MLAKTFTATPVGLDGMTVEVEVDGNRGTPTFILIGLPSKATDEARERITSALQNCGVRIRSKRTIVNLAPADIPKHGTGFDLAIAVGLLKMYGEVICSTEDTLFLGELSLDGHLKPVRGALALILHAQKKGFRRVILPAANADEVSIISGITLHPLQHLQEYLQFAQGSIPLPTLTPQPFVPQSVNNSLVFLEDIIGQPHAKRALTIAAAGNHNLLLSGPPGVGKSMLARAFHSILPPLTEQEAIEVTRIHSICGLTPQGLVRSRPFRTPHHTSSQIGLIGGGATLQPGEISLAHRGVLFLDEFAEFSRQTLDCLRQPLEEGSISIARASGRAEYPARFCLIAAMNPCPCGYKYSLHHKCSCTPHQLNFYQKKISGPLLDRFDLKVVAQEVRLSTTSRTVRFEETSESVRAQVAQARQRQLDRYTQLRYSTNAELPGKEVLKYCQISPTALSFANSLMQTYALSGRSYFKVLKVSQTIADLEQAPQITIDHLAEAVQYRLEKKHA